MTVKEILMIEARSTVRKVTIYTSLTVIPANITDIIEKCSHIIQTWSQALISIETQRVETGCADSKISTSFTINRTDFTGINL